MAEEESSGEKTEAGSEKKTRDAIESGNIPFSREATVFMSLGAMLMITSFVVANNVRTLAGVLSQLFANPSRAPFETTADTLKVFDYAGEAAITFLLPILLTMATAGIVAGFAQGLPRPTFSRIAPKWSKLSPASGIKRLIGRDGQIEFLKNLVKLLLVAVVVSVVLKSEIFGIVQTLYVDPAAICTMTLAIIARLLAGSLVAYAILTAGDLVWVRVRWAKDLRMTRQEVKDEMKDAEGDPILKAKRRSLALDRARRRMMASVPRATMVIANPTHYAIALRYVREEGGAPIVLAKGKDLVALKIREIAEGLNIPVIEDKALARSMYDHVEVSQLIPSEFYKAVAELIHFLQARHPKANRAPVKV